MDLFKELFSAVRRLNSMVLLASIIAGSALTGCKVQDEKPNIVIILVDDMGYGDPGCYNPQSGIPTPNIDKLAEEGMRFTDAHAPGPLCHPSRYGLMTGTYPFRTDISVWPERPLIREGQVTIASLLKSQGYHTSMVGKWHLGFLEKGYENPLSGGPVDRGFDSFFGFRASTDIPPYFYIRDDRAEAPPTDHIEANASEGWSPIQGSFWRAGGIAPGLELKDVLPRFTGEAIEVIQDHAVNDQFKDQPLMLYLAYPSPHTPWLPSTEFEGKSGAGMYGDFMMMVDAEIGKVVQALEDQGMLENTLLVFTSDNGPVWYDSDVKRLGHDSSGGLRGMKADAWEAGHRMPFIVRWPGHVKKGSVSDQTICFTDLMATFADAVGTTLPEGAGPDSYSFLPVLTGEQPEDQPIRGPVVMMPGSSGAAMIRSGDWKLINQLGSGGFSDPGYIKPGPGDPEGQLYNLADDPGETNNLYLEHPEIVSRLQGEMDQITAKGGERGSRHATESKFMTYKGLVMAGYQGWFNCEGDGADRGWTHYSKGGKFEDGSCTIDYWPEMDEYKVKYKTPFKFADGSPAYVFSSFDESTVDLHFKWMKEYGIDGVFMQRFFSVLQDPNRIRHNDKVLQSAIHAANKYGVAICLMYDIGGMDDSQYKLIFDDWRHLVDDLRLTNQDEKTTYLYHNGKPLVAFWGISAGTRESGHIPEIYDILNFFKNDPVYGGCSIHLGIPSRWRTLGSDTKGDPRLHDVLKQVDVIHPWLVGRFNEESYEAFWKEHIEGDIAWCREMGKSYAPTVFPGFSWYNMKDDVSDKIPRNKGEFFWKQISGAIGGGAEMLYVAMFDEIDEGTAIFKCAHEVPVGQSIFVPYEKEVPSDHYLWLTGMAGKMLRGEIPFTSNLPVRETN